MNVLRNKKALDSKSNLTTSLAGKKKEIGQPRSYLCIFYILIQVMVIHFFIKVSPVKRLSTFNRESPGSLALFIQHEAKQVTGLNATCLTR